MLSESSDAARERSQKLRGSIRIEIVDPYRTNYPASWGAQVELRSTDGDRFAISRKDCKGDPELALDVEEMRTKAMGLFVYGGLDESDARVLCEEILSLPESGQTPNIFTHFMHHLGIV